MASRDSAVPLNDDILRDILEESRGTSSQTATAPGIGEDSIEQGEAAYRIWDRRRRAWIRYRRRRAKAAQLNLLDHESRVLNRDEAMMIGLGMGISLQGIFLSGLLGLILTSLGMMTGVVTLVKKFMPIAEPILDNVEGILRDAYQKGLPIEMLEHELGKQLVAHSFQKRITKYAILTTLGGGAGSFWLSAGCLAITLISLPDLLHSGFALVSGAAFFKHSFEQVADEILSYRFMHHPEVVAERIYEATREYNRRLEKQPLHAEEGLALTATLDFVRSQQMAASPASAVLPPAQREQTFETLYREEKKFNTEMLGAVTALLDKVMVQGVAQDKAPPIPPELQIALEKFAHNVAFGHPTRQTH